MKLSDEQSKIRDFAIKAPPGTVIVISGSAGAGKSTLIDAIVDRLSNVLKCAFTGRAAQNIEGVTIHSLFSLRVGMIYDPGWCYTTYRKHMYATFGKEAGRHFNKKKMEVLAATGTIIVDEAWAVTCDIIDAMDMVLRGVRKKPDMAFGGCRMIFAGDSGQLNPIIPDVVRDTYHQMGYNHPFDLTTSRVFQKAAEEQAA